MQTPVKPLLLGMGWFPDQLGGLNRYYRGLFEALDRYGYQPKGIVVGPAADAPESVSEVSMAPQPLSRRITRYAGAVRRASVNVDLVDSHFALYAAAPVVFGWLHARPLVVHFQGPWAEENRETPRLAAIAGVKRRIECSVYRRASGIIVLSLAFKRILVERYRISPWKIAVVPPAIALGSLQKGSRRDARAVLALPASSFIALAVRRLVDRMGLEILLDSWKAVESISDDAMLIIAGEGPNRHALETKAKEAGLSSVQFIGRVPDNALLQYYRAADVSVVPSVELEGYGLVVLESLACGTPVIGTEVGGLPEALEPLDKSLVVPARDPAALAARLQAAVGQPASLPNADRCRTYAGQFSWERAVKSTVQVYDHAIRPPRKREPRVVVLDHCARLSGGELALLRLLPALSGVEIHVILGEDGPLVSGLQKNGISVEVLALAEHARNLHRDRIHPLGIPPRVALSTALHVVRLAHRLRDLKPDLIHTNSLKAAVYGGVAGRLAGIPVIWHVRDRLALDYLPASAIKALNWLHPRLAAAVIANSHATLESFAASDHRAVVIPSPVALTRTTSSKDGRHRPFTIGMVGRIAPWKGQDIFIDAFAQAFPNSREEAIIVGAPLFGEEPFADQLRAQAAKLHLNGRLKFVGFKEDVAAELENFDALVHASVISEPFGQVVVEGMAAGLPVVAAGAGGPAEIIKSGVNGLLYQPGNRAELAGSLRRLADDPLLRQQLGEAARVRSRDFIPQAIAKKVLNLYSAVLSNSPASQSLILP